MGPRTCLFFVIAAISPAQLLTPVWVELGDRGQTLARVVVQNAADCPAVQMDSGSRKMELRAPVPEGFAPLCALAIPVGTMSARVNGVKLALPRPDPAKIVAFGDTGCRIAGARIQNCNDPAKWPFEKIAKSAADARPDLMMDVGDFLYREDACPADKASFCGGSPHGDNWETWNADFFRPGAKLLAAAPWILARGNHENCARAWRGWGYYLDTHPWTGVCQPTPAPVVVEMGSFQVVVFDSSAAGDRMPEKLIDTYASHLSTVKASHAWLLDHHPFWAFKGVKDEAPAPETEGLEKAWDKASPKGIDLVLSGHTHTFELLSFAGMRPVQLVAGNGGTKLEDNAASKIKGLEIRGFKVAEAETEEVFGYTVVNRQPNGWKLELRTPSGKKLVKCSIRGSEADCKGD
jgi:Calcineurin-like phosphoesterase